MRRPLFLFLLCLISLVLLACQTSEEEKIQQVLNRREEALRNRDLSLYLSCISQTYQDKEEDFTRLRNRVEGYFRNFDQIEYSNWDRSIQIEREVASVTQQFRLEVMKGGKRSRYSGMEALFLKKEGKKWRIIGGL